MESRHPTRRYSIKSKSPPEVKPIPPMDYEQASVDSFDSASRAVAEMLTKPEHLDSLDQIRMKVARKKATVESQLRNAVQTQLDGVQNGLDLLKDSTLTVKDIKKSMLQVEAVYKQCEELSDVMGPIKEVNRRFQQLRITNTHINNIFGVPHVVSEIRTLLEERNLLYAHQLLAELEHTRDELLVQLHYGVDAYVDRNTALHRYFEPLVELSDSLAQQLWLIIDRVTENVVDNPVEVVTALRIVQREEKADRCIADSLTEKNITISLIPNRPKKWRSKCVDVMDRSILTKFNELQPGDIIENKDWLDEYLTEVATVCFQDLKAMKENGESCFPPDYDILDFFVQRYQVSLKKVVADLVASDLNARDIIKLMVWIGDVRQSFREALRIDLEQHGPLIDQTLEKDLQSTCVEQVKWNINEMVSKMIQTEKEDWLSHELPQEDNNGCFYTTVALLLFEMVDQNLSAMSMFGLDTKEKVLQSCLSAVEAFQDRYRVEIQETFEEHISSGRNTPPLFFLYMIAITNNCKSCIEFSEQLKKRFITEYGGDIRLNSETSRIFIRMCESFEKLGLDCCDKVVKILFEDLTPLVDGLMTKERWLQKPIDILNKLEGTLVDYNGDLGRLKPAYHSHAIVQIQKKVFKTYIEAMMKKKIVLKKKDDRQKAASFIKEESHKLGNMFQRLSHATNPKYTQVLEDLASLLHSTLENMPYIIGGFAGRCPDLKYNHVVAILAMRGDLNKNGCQKLMERTTLRPNQTGDKEEEEEIEDPTRYSSRARAKKKERSILSEVDVTNPWSLF